ncbi:MAG: hypothetical protein IT429_06970 [Gemmataceae bacterium]|nr:hypothetical protein [Gemmataceae bacterium]
MPMPPYPILCYTRGCGRPAVYKIASRWSDGVTEELKTYALTCPQCLAEWFARSRPKHKTCHLTHGESLDPPGIYELRRGQRDQQLRHLPDLEKELERQSAAGS